MLKAMAIRLELIAIRFHLLFGWRPSHLGRPSLLGSFCYKGERWLKAIAPRLEAMATRFPLLLGWKLSLSGVQAIATRLEAIAARFQLL